MNDEKYKGLEVRSGKWEMGNEKWKIKDEGQGGGSEK